jgi:hypothetical protein
VVLGINFIDYVGDHAVLVNKEGYPRCTHIFLPIPLFLHPYAILFVDGFIGIRDE